MTHTIRATLFLVVLFSAILLLTAGCAPITSGVVVDMQYEEERTWTQYFPRKIGGVTMIIPIRHRDDEDWIVVIEGDCGGNNETKCQRTLYISEEEWLNLEIGNDFSMGPECSSEDPVEKKKER